MSKLGFGIVGTGLIAGAIADALSKSAKATLVAVSSRKMETAQQFVKTRAGVAAVQGVDSLLARNDVQAVYVATPTAVKEEIARAAIEADKHVLVDKPFVSWESLRRIIDLAAARGIAFMDATHFVHHPRTTIIKNAIPEKIGTPKSLHTAFYFPLSDRNNIRFDVSQEPMGALGDMGWYSMRAIVEYLQPEGKVITAVTSPEYDEKTGAIVRTSGLIAFEGGKVSTFDVGYTAGATLMDLQLLGTTGMIGIDDFVLVWANSWAFQSPESTTGYSYRSGIGTRADITFIATPAHVAQEVSMLDHFSEIALSGKKNDYIAASLRTQEYIDTLWMATASNVPAPARI